MLQRLRNKLLPPAKPAPTGRRPHVVVVGVGFAGLNAAKELAGEPVEVTVVDRNNYHTFQPLLYQVATAGLEPEEVAHSARALFHDYENVDFRLGTVTQIDADARRLHFETGPALDYDALILAAGAVMAHYGVEGAREHTYAIKTLPDAIALRSHVMQQFERYDQRQVEGDGALRFVLVGGGATGVEMAGALVELFGWVLQKDFKRFDAGKAEVVLIEMGDGLLPSYVPRLQAHTRRVLETRGVDVRLNTVVEKVTAEDVVLKGGELLRAQTVVWAAGIQAPPFVGTLGAEQLSGGRVRVERDLSVPGRPEVFVAGDLSAAGPEPSEGELYAQVAQAAIQQGRHAARQVLARLAGRATVAFVYDDLGQAATIGRNQGVAELPGGLRFGGFVAWLLWAGVHIVKLAGFRNRANVFVNWAYNYFTYDRSARLILDAIPVPDAASPAVELGEGDVRQQAEAVSQGG